MRIRGIARVDRRTKNLIHRIGSGEIAVISHADLDASCATALAARKVAAVVNAQRSLSGRFPHPGPHILLQARIPLVDCVGDSVMTRIEEGMPMEIVDGSVFADGALIGAGEMLTLEALDERLAEAKRNVGAELAKFVENTLTYVVGEQALLFDSPTIPALRTRIRGRHCLIVVRGPGAEADLAAIRSYVNAVRPVLIGVDGGADVLMQQGYRPHLIIGDMDSVSDAALKCGAELIAHAYPDGTAPGAARLEAMGLPHLVLASRGTSEDVAMLLAYERQADLIAAVGTHFALTEFLEKARGGMSSTFLVRLKVGSILVDAKGISRLYPSTGPFRLFVYMGLVAAVTAAVVLATSEPIRDTLDLWLLRLIYFFQSAF